MRDEDFSVYQELIPCFILRLGSGNKAKGITAYSHSPEFDIDEECLVTGLRVMTFFFSSRRRHTRLQGDWSSDVCSSDLVRACGHPSRLAEFIIGPRFARTRWLAPQDDAMIMIVCHMVRTALFRRLHGARLRSEERRVGKECRSRVLADHLKKKKQRTTLG